jgi:hypothetical protein
MVTHDMPYSRNTAVEIRGPVVAEHQLLFFATWKRQSGEPVRFANDFRRWRDRALRPSG